MSKLVALVLLVASAAQAAPPDDTKVQAKAHFAAGSAFYDAGSYDRAVEEYLAAYRLFPKADFLFNIAQAYRLKGEKRPSLAYYRRYLAEVPAGRGSAEAQQYVQQLEQELDQEPPPPPLVETPRPAPPPTVIAPSVEKPAPAIVAVPPAPSRKWVWVGVGVGAVVVAIALGIGLGFGLSHDATAPPTFFGTVGATFR
jgi:iron complex outermembrane receptor protein